MGWLDKIISVTPITELPEGWTTGIDKDGNKYVETKKGFRMTYIINKEDESNTSNKHNIR
jgi:hypothetical protein